jgi:hypothetical protein
MVLNYFGIRFSLLRNLILPFFLWRCAGPAPGDSVITIQWRDSVPEGLIVPKDLLPRIDDNAIQAGLQIHLLNDDSPVAVFGEYSFFDETVIFRPLIPLTPSLQYQVQYLGKSLGQVRVPAPHASTLSKVLGIYPTQDTVPENLLKVYIHFSRPMREADPLSYVRLRSDESDTVAGAFLDLRPALWNREGTLLTLWLDPGRIKRNLQPNRREGPPLVEGNRYELIVLNTWPAKDGSTLKEKFAKEYFVGKRDSDSPDPAQWEVISPAPGTTDTLFIQLRESLDFVLLKETIDVVGGEENRVRGELTASHEESVVKFVPDEQWRRGNYSIRFESRLEDLAGNNLNRPFDQDLKVKRRHDEKEFYQLKFSVE